MARSDLDGSLIDGEGLDKGSSTAVYSSLGFDFFSFFSNFYFCSNFYGAGGFSRLDYIMNTPKFLHLLHIISLLFYF